MSGDRRESDRVCLRVLLGSDVLYQKGGTGDIVVRARELIPEVQLKRGTVDFDDLAARTIR